MASPTRVTERIRKAKRTANGQGRKREQAAEQRAAAEKKLAAALGEPVALPTIR
ncbi:MAG: hypothetical protein FJ100_15680 [Deltaproteobacteria bacterium]|nr:hypothetical protein [Deltaproteobacteria bacterium]